MSASNNGHSPARVTSSWLAMSDETLPGLQDGNVAAAGGFGQASINGVGSGGDMPSALNWDPSANAGIMGTGGGMDVNLNNSTLNVNNGIPAAAAEPSSYHHQNVPVMPANVNELMKPTLARVDVSSLDPALRSVARYLSVPESVSGSKVGFPVNLTRMLECVEPMRLEQIVEWLGNGRGFIIHDTEAFLRSVKPQFFP